MNKDCKIVKDLLPGYIDKITSEETNKFIEEHLKECDSCKKYYEEMNSEIEKEAVKDTELVKEIKKYKRKIFTLKLFVILFILANLIFIIGMIGFKYTVVKKTIAVNVNNESLLGNFRIEEYDESIERYDKHITYYYGESKMKKVYGDEVLEYWEQDKHYYIDNENKTYYIVNEHIHDGDNESLNIPIDAIDELNSIIEEDGKNPFNILKFVLFTDGIEIQEEPFRAKPYYIIKNTLTGAKIYVDQDTFFVERVRYNATKSKEYRTLTSSVSWHELVAPDLTGYVEIKK